MQHSYLHSKYPIYMLPLGEVPCTTRTPPLACGKENRRRTRGAAETAGENFRQPDCVQSESTVPRLAWPVAWGLSRTVRATEFIRQNPGPRDEGDARRPSSRDVPFFAVTLRSVEKPELALVAPPRSRCCFPAARVSGGVPLAKAHCRQSVAATGGELRK